jgi:hypothetical protein
MEQTKSGENTKIISKAKPGVVERFSVYNFEEVDLPQAIETSYNKWVIYGEDNLFPQHLINAWLQSSTHNALTTGIIQMISGDGLTFDPLNLQVEAFRLRINRKGETLEELVNKTAFDLYLHGYFAWQVIWNVARTSIVEIYHTPAEQVRSGKSDDLGIIEEYYISWDWGNYRKQKFEPKRVKAFDPLDRSEGKQMIFVKQYRPNQFYYSTPSYIGGMNWILIDNRIGEFHLNNIENGFFPSSVVQFFNGEPPQETKRQIEQNFMDKFTGKSQAKIVFVYNNNLDEKVSFDTYEPANIDKRFRDLMPEVHTNIMIAHRVPSPLLFGIRDGGGLGNNAEELESSSLLMNKMVIVPYQQIIIDTLKKIFKINGWETEIRIETLQPIQFLEGQSGDADATTDDRPTVTPTVQRADLESDSRLVISDNMVDPILQHLKKKGQRREDLEAQGWVLVQVDDMLTAEGIKLKHDPDKFAVSTAALESDPEADSSLDVGLYKIRYEYRGPRDERNRDFCAAVLDLKYIYRYEDINDMSSMMANPEFGSYSIWDYKGSYGCRHRWHRLVFFRKRDPRGRFLPDEGLENDRQVGPGDTPPSVIPDDKQATTVNDKPTR